jgi:hypothetical protein
MNECAAIYSDIGDMCAGFTGMVELKLIYDSSWVYVFLH